MSTRVGPADTTEALVYTCRSCGTDFAPACGECPDCGGWTFTAALTPALPLELPQPRSPVETNVTLTPNGSYPPTLSVPAQHESGWIDRRREQRAQRRRDRAYARDAACFADAVRRTWREACEGANACQRIDSPSGHR